jgi:hypothetical protein
MRILTLGPAWLCTITFAGCGRGSIATRPIPERAVGGVRERVAFFDELIAVDPVSPLSSSVGIVHMVGRKPSRLSRRLEISVLSARRGGPLGSAVSVTSSGRFRVVDGHTTLEVEPCRTASQARKREPSSGGSIGHNPLGSRNTRFRTRAMAS